MTVTVIIAEAQSSGGSYRLLPFQTATTYFSSGIFLQTTTICPVFESILVVTGRQRQNTVFAFSSFVTTQCSMSSAFGGGTRLRTAAG
jgi:hypothetical protein